MLKREHIKGFIFYAIVGHGTLETKGKVDLAELKNKKIHHCLNLIKPECF